MNWPEIWAWLGEGHHWVLVLIVAWFVIGGIEESWRKAIRNRRQHQIDLAYARQGLPPARQVIVYRSPAEDDEDWDADDDEDEQQVVVPAAVIPSPPGAKPVHGVPGPCRHEALVPVITDDGELVRWICKNYPRCSARFPADTAIYEPAEES